MKTKAQFDNDNAEKCFRAWQAKYSQCLVTNWTVSADYDKISFDAFSLKRYTGRSNFNLKSN